MSLSATERPEPVGIDREDHVVFDGVSKTFGTEHAVEEVSIRIRRGEFFSLLGPSGCGKTTTLRMLAGFVKPTEGRIRVSDRDITMMPPETRNIGVVFQDYAIFPHMTVFDNVAFGLKMRKMSKPAIRTAVEQALARVDLDGSEGKYRKQLSGGQQQRVALARALVIEPDVLVLDEPLSALDLKLRDQMRFWIRDIQRTLGITTVYVTHDQTEALTMSDRIGVMRDGRLLQVGAPRELYDDPTDLRVANFLGTATLLEGQVVKVTPTHVTMAIGDTRLVGRSPKLAEALERLRPGAPCSLVLRPEQVQIINPESAQHLSSGGQQLTCRVRSVAFEGALLSYNTDVEGIPHPVLVHASVRDRSEGFTVGATAVLHWPTDGAVVLPSKNETIRSGEHADRN